MTSNKYSIGKYDIHDSFIQREIMINIKPVIYIIGMNKYNITIKSCSVSDFIEKINYTYKKTNKIYLINKGVPLLLELNDYIFPGDVINLVDKSIKYWKIFIIYPNGIKYPKICSKHEPIELIDLAKQKIT